MTNIQNCSLDPIKYSPAEKRYGPQTAHVFALKITVVAVTVIALAALSYVSFGAALPLLTSGLFTWSSGLGLLGGIGTSLAALTTPLIAHYRNMGRVTHKNEKEITLFLRDVGTMALIAGSAFVLHDLLEKK